MLQEVFTKLRENVNRELAAKSNGSFRVKDCQAGIVPGKCMAKDLSIDSRTPESCCSLTTLGWCSSRKFTKPKMPGGPWLAMSSKWAFGSAFSSHLLQAWQLHCRCPSLSPAKPALALHGHRRRILPARPCSSWSSLLSNSCPRECSREHGQQSPCMWFPADTRPREDIVASLHRGQAC